jgi:hypothetical protein
LIVSKEGCGELFGDQYIFRQNISLPSIQALIAKLVIDASTPGVETFTTITTVLDVLCHFLLNVSLLFSF